jgi:hypothetical protein
MSKTQVLVRVTPTGEMFCKTSPWGNEDYGTSGLVGGDVLYVIDIADLWSRVTKLTTQIERLARIERAARAYVAAWDAGDTMAHGSRAALREALEER